MGSNSDDAISCTIEKDNTCNATLKLAAPLHITDIGLKPAELTSNTPNPFREKWRVVSTANSGGQSPSPP